MIVRRFKNKNGKPMIQLDGVESDGTPKSVPDRRKDYTGQRFGMLVVIEDTGTVDSKGRVYWRCACDCGGERICTRDYWTRSAKPSCGCSIKGEKNPNYRTGQYVQVMASDPDTRGCGKFRGTAGSEFTLQVHDGEVV